MTFLGSIGGYALGKAAAVRHVAAVVWAVLGLAVRPSSWSRVVRDVLARQILFTGVDAVRFMAMIALLIGVSVVVQVQMWVARAGQSEILGPLLVIVLMREVGPVLVNFIVIGRTGAAIAAEMASMRVGGDIAVLDAQGIDPMIYLVMPRVLGVAVSVFCLSVLFIIISFGSGYLSGLPLGVSPGDPTVFLDSVFGGISREDVYNLMAKTLIPGMLTGTIACLEGMNVEGAVTEIPQAATRAVVRSTGTLFVVSAIVSILTYA